MTCTRCQRQICKRFGYFGKRRIQRWRCQSCNSTFCEPHARLTRDTMISNPETVTQAIQCLLEGCSIRSTERLTGLNRNTIMRLLLVAGDHCGRFSDAKVRRLRPRYLELDEIWTFVGKKDRHLRKGDAPEFGSQWVFVAMDAESKFVASYRVGQRLKRDTALFLRDLYDRIEGGTQITTDGLNHCRQCVPEAFGVDTHFAQLTKMFGDYGQFDSPEARYSPPRISGVISKVRMGHPDPGHISTSFVERQNLTMRQAMRRFTRLTLGYSKTLSHLKAAVALHFDYYNFCRIHSSLRVIPVMEAALADHVWSIEELLFNQK